MILTRRDFKTRFGGELAETGILSDGFETASAQILNGHDYGCEFRIAMRNAWQGSFAGSAAIEETEEDNCNLKSMRRPANSNRGDSEAAHTPFSSGHHA